MLSFNYLAIFIINVYVNNIIIGYNRKVDITTNKLLEEL